MLGKMPIEVRKRVEEESAELTNKITKLEAFIDKQTDKTSDEYKDLVLQLDVMKEYNAILRVRLKRDAAKPGNSCVNADIYYKFVKGVKDVIDEMKEHLDGISYEVYIEKLENLIPKEEA